MPPRSARFARLACALGGLTILLSAAGYLAAGSPYGDDNSSHLAVIRSVAADLRSGRTDFYLPENNLGVPLFVSYPPLAAWSVASIAALLGGPEHATAVFKASIVLAWVLMAPAWYLGGRWLGLDRRRAAAFGIVSLAMADLTDRGLTMGSALHTGLYSQTFGMLVLPATLGAVRRWVSADQAGRSLRWAARATIGLWLTCLFHAFSGMVAILGAWLFVVCPFRGGSLAHRALRIALVQGVAFVMLGFWLWPLLAHRDLVGGIPWKHAAHEGSPIVSAVKALLGGDLFDARRFPWMTMAILVAIPRVVRRLHAPLHAWMLAGFAASFLLYLGPTNFGAVFRSLPLQSEMNVTRYLIGIHLFGALFVAVGAVFVIDVISIRILRRFGPNARSIVAVGIAVTVAVVLADRYTFGRRAFRTIDTEKSGLAALAGELASSPGSRFVADATLGTTAHFYRDLLPTLSGRPHIQSYGMTYHATLSTFYAEYFDFSPAACALYGVGALVGRDGNAPARVREYPKTFDDGRHQIYECPNDEGLFGFVDLPVSIEGEPKAIRASVLETLPLYEMRALARILPPGSDPAEKAEHHFVIAAAGEVPEALRETVDRLRAEATVRPASRIVAARSEKTRYEAVTEVGEGPRWLLLKLNAFPYWTATVDGERVPIATVAPNHQAVRVPGGRHTVRFEYHFPTVWKLLAVAALAAVIALAILAVRRVDGRRR